PSSRTAPSPSPSTSHFARSLHDALPIFRSSELSNVGIYSMHTEWDAPYAEPEHVAAFDVNAFFVGSNIRKAVNEGRASYVPMFLDRKSTRLNSSHVKISYAVFCSNKKQ